MDNNDDVKQSQHLIGEFAGNRANLRSKAVNQIKRVTAISEHLGALGDFLVTTWGGVLISISILAIGFILIFLVLRLADMHIFFENALPALLMLIGVILVALNALLTNPVQGSQAIVSTKFIFTKMRNFGTSKVRRQEKWFRFWDNGKKDIIETTHRRKHYYIAVYNVRGIVSPTTFDSDLELAASADEGLLHNNERDTTLVTVVSIDQTHVKKRELPKNATPAMIQKRNLQYNLTANLPYNQQISTSMLMVAPNANILKNRITHLESAFHQGLVVGYKRLKGKDAQAVFMEIFGEGRV